jgi:hypothetical protein
MRLRCERYRRELERYADVAEGLPASARVARHLEACDGCRAHWAGLRRLGAELREALIVPAPSFPAEESRWARVDAIGPRSSDRRVVSLALGAALAAAAVMGLLAWHPWRGGTPPRLVAIRPPGTGSIHPMGPRTPVVPKGSVLKDFPGRPAPSPGERGRNVRPGSNRDVGETPALPESVVPDAGARPSPRTRRQVPSVAPERQPGGMMGPPVPDEQFLDGRDPSLLAHWSPLERKEQARLAAVLRQLPPPADDFVRIPLPRLAAADPQSGVVAEAIDEYKKQAKVVDARLFRKVTLQLKAVSLADFCTQLQEQTGVDLRASRAVADEKVTVFVKEQRARDLMRAVARLFGVFWLRTGAEGTYRYELSQDLKSQLAEEELRNRDLDAALLALDAEMAKYRPYLDMSFAQLEKASEESRKNYLLLFDLMHNAGWGGMQLYHRLTPAERAALVAGQELVFRPDAPNPDRRLPAEWQRPLLLSMGGSVWVNSQPTEIKDVPGIKINQVRCRLNRSELGQVSLGVRTTAVWAERSGQALTFSDKELATSRSPSTDNPDNAIANAALRDRPPFNQVVSLRPEPSCPGLKGVWTGDNAPTPWIWMVHDLKQPHVFSADVWEAVHRETGLPIVADAYTRLSPVAKVVVSQKTVFDALCQVGDAMGVRWTKDGQFLLGRSTSYFWDKLKEVPNRLLQRWAKSRDTNGGLPLADFLEMASLSDQQLGSALVAEGIMYGWGLREWSYLAMPATRQDVRFLATLTPEQRQRALQPTRLPFKELTPAQQQAGWRREEAAQAEVERQGDSPVPIRREEFDNAVVMAEYVPAGWYVWMPPQASPEHPWPRPLTTVGGRTAAEALAAARQIYPAASPDEVKPARDGHFSASIGIVGPWD